MATAAACGWTRTRRRRRLGRAAPAGSRRSGGGPGHSRAARSICFRVAGIYGPGRSPFADLRAGRGRRIDKPGHCFGRIHRDDIARAVVAAMGQGREAGVRVLNLNDDEPVESAEATAEAARLLGVEPPPLAPFEQGAAGDVADGAQLLGRGQAGRQPEDAGGAWSAMAVS